MKKEYLIPEMEEVTISIKGQLLNASATGFNDDPDYDENHWVLN